MDELDFAILRELAWVPGDPGHRTRGIQRSWDVARALGVHGNTIKRRMAAMTRDGVLSGVHAIPLPSALGLFGSAFTLHYDEQAAKDKAVSHLKRFPGAAGYSNFFGSELWATFLGLQSDEVESTASAFSAQTGAHVPPRKLFDFAWPTRERALTPLDECILRTLAGDAHRTPEEVALGAGVTRKSVAARLRRLMDAGSFCVRPQIDLARVRGVLTFVLAADLPPTRTVEAHAALLAAFPEAFERTTPDLPSAYLFLHRADVRGIREALELATHASPEARNVRALLMSEVGSCHEGVQTLLASRPEGPRGGGSRGASARNRPGPVTPSSA